MHIPIESLNLQMLNVGFARHDGDWNWQEVMSPFTRIYCVTRGEAWLHLEDGERLRMGDPNSAIRVRLRPGHLYMVPAYKVHTCECSGVFEHYYLHVYEGYRAETNVLDMYDFPTEVEAHEGEARLMQEMTAWCPDAGLPGSDPQTYDNVRGLTDYVRRYNALPLWEKMRLRGATLMLFARFLEQARPKVWTRDERMRRVLAWVHEHIDETLDIGQLAEQACVTRPYLIRLFKRDIGLSPLQYINRKKVERAQLLLLTEEMTVKEVAYKLGFVDHSYFIRLFKKTTGRTPIAYRTMFG